MEEQEVNLAEVYEPLTKQKTKSLAVQIKTWKEQFQDIFILTVDKVMDSKNFDGIFRIPSKEMMDSLVSQNRSEGELNQELLKMCVLYPEPILFEQILEKHWGIAVPLSKKLLDQTSVTKEARVKKL